MTRQQTLVDSLNAQVTAEGKIAELKAAQTEGAKGTADREVSADAEEAIKEAARHDEKMLELQRQVTEKRLAVTHASVQEIIDAEKQLADREFQIKNAALDRELGALTALPPTTRKKSKPSRTKRRS